MKARKNFRVINVPNQNSSASETKNTLAVHSCGHYNHGDGQRLESLASGYWTLSFTQSSGLVSH